MKPTIITDTISRTIVVRAENESQALNCAWSYLRGIGLADQWEQRGCSLIATGLPTRQYRVEFIPLFAPAHELTYEEEIERWIPA